MESSEPPCPCQGGKAFQQFREINLERGTSLAVAISTYTQISSLLLSARACDQCSNNAFVLQGAFAALNHVLQLFEAEQNVYAPTPSILNLRSNDRIPSSGHSSVGLMPNNYAQASRNNLRERFTFGGIILDDSESAIIAKRLIRTSVIGIGQSLRWIDRKSRLGVSIRPIDRDGEFDEEMRQSINQVQRLLARVV